MQYHKRLQHSSATHNLPLCLLSHGFYLLFFYNINNRYKFSISFLINNVSNNTIYNVHNLNFRCHFCKSRKYNDVIGACRCKRGQQGAVQYRLGYEPIKTKSVMIITYLPLLGENMRLMSQLMKLKKSINGLA